MLRGGRDNHSDDVTQDNADDHQRSEFRPRRIVAKRGDDGGERCPEILAFVHEIWLSVFDVVGVLRERKISSTKRFAFLLREVSTTRIVATAIRVSEN